MHSFTFHSFELVMTTRVQNPVSYNVSPGKHYNNNNKQDMLCAHFFIWREGKRNRGVGSECNSAGDYCETLKVYVQSETREVEREQKASMFNCLQESIRSSLSLLTIFFVHREGVSKFSQQRHLNRACGLMIQIHMIRFFRVA